MKPPPHPWRVRSVGRTGSSRPRPTQTVTPSADCRLAGPGRPLEGVVGLSRPASARVGEMAAFAVRAAISPRAAGPALPTRRVGSGRRDPAAANEARAAAKDDASDTIGLGHVDGGTSAAFFATATTRRRLAVAVAAALALEPAIPRCARGLSPTWSRTRLAPQPRPPSSTAGPRLQLLSQRWKVLETG